MLYYYKVQQYLYILVLEHLRLHTIEKKILDFLEEHIVNFQGTKPYISHTKYL